MRSARTQMAGIIQQFWRVVGLTATLLGDNWHANNDRNETALHSTILNGEMNTIDYRTDRGESVVSNERIKRCIKVLLISSRCHIVPHCNGKY